jgi:hypothetical protein
MRTTAKVKTLIMTAGYVESNHNASVIASHSKGFNSVEEALRDFATAIIQNHLEAVEYRIKNPCKGCCKKAIGIKAKFCSECGQKLVVPTFNFDRCVQVIYNFFVGDNDSTGSTFDYLENRGWSYGGSGHQFEDPIVWVFECAEDILAQTHFGNLKEEESFRRKLDGHYEITGKKKVKVYEE